MVLLEGELVGFFIGPLEIGAGIVARAVGACEERPIEVVLGLTEEELGSVAVFAK